MSESDSFISEVSEEVRRERLFRMLRRYGWLIGAAILLIVGGAAANEWRKARLQAAAEAAGDALRDALMAPDAAARAESLAAVAAGGGPADPLARIAHAGGLVAAGRGAEAAEVLGALAGDGAVAPVYRALAALQRVMILGDALPASERLAALEALAAEGAPFRLLALEQRALANLGAGETTAAISDLQAILAAPEAPEGLRGRAEQLVVAVGGATPDAAPLPVAPAGAPSGG